jgi:gluconate 2-dehydrogenase gamma chain
MSADDPARPDLISRRSLLGRVGAAGAIAALPEVLGPAAEAAGQAPRATAREPLESLTPAEADTLEAIAARLVPSDAESPGAADARAAHYIDRALGGALASFREVYRQGLAAVDVFARSSKGAAFAQLQPSDQDAVLTAMERNTATGFEAGPGAAAFFSLLLAHTLQGTFGDPYYGGNRNFVGWDLVGYPGVRLAVTGEQQNFDAKLAPTRMGAYDYAMFSRRKPARADRGGAHDTHGD